MHSVNRFGLAERDDVLDALTGMIRAADRPGATRLGLIEAPPGCGKTVLLDAVAARAGEADILVLRVNCARQEQHRPLAAVRQILLGCPPSPTTAAVAERLDHHTLAALQEPSGAGQIPARIHDDLTTLLSTHGQQRRVAILIDDVHAIDEPSAAALLYATRRLARSRATLIAAQPSHLSRQSSLSYHLQVDPGTLLLTLGPLTPAGIRGLLAEDPAAAADPGRAAAASHAATGGNPLLVRAFARDRRSFDRALYGFLQRAPQPVSRVAAGLGVLGGASTPATLARLLRVQPADVVRATAVLTDSGLLADGRFVHADLATGVLAGLPPAERADLHLRAAELLFEEGATQRTLAAHLIAAGAAPMPWAACVLYEAAGRAAADGDLPFATACLELAGHGGDRTGRVRALMLELTWAVDPTAGDRHVSSLQETLCRDELSVSDAASLIRHQLWHGRVAESTDLLTRLAARAGDDPQEAGELHALRLGLAHSFPTVAAGVLPPPELPAEDLTPAIGGTDLRLRAAGALAGVLSNHVSSRMTANARQVLRSRHDEGPLLPARYDALRALLYAEELDEAAARCDQLLEQAPPSDVPAWHAMLLSIKAEIARRCGDLQAAGDWAEAALRRLPEHAWGTHLAQPLSTLVLVLSARGDLDRARAIAERPLLPAALQSGPGLAYRYAIGCYQLAARAPGAAMQTFLECGKWAKEWNLDMPTLAPWRGGVGQAHLMLDRSEHAAPLFVEQLRLLRGRYPRTRAITLRQLASTESAEQRTHLLRIAVQLLEACGDGAELARTLYELGLAESMLGDDRNGRLHTQLAMRTASRSGVPLHHGQPVSEVSATVLAKPGALLTEAELKVAMMAARGHTNRQIAEQLSITPSTVEQHLTRVFRKLKVKKRRELPQELGLNAATSIV